MSTSRPAWRSHLSLSELFIAAIAGHIVKHAQSLAISEMTTKVRKDQQDVHEYK
jgi:hypothetical protein